MAGYIGSKASVVSSGAERKKTFTITGATTSLTGLNYTVGKVHVFQNGVRLVDGTDYTATNGTTITLTVAAQSGDNVVVISQASFQVADALLTSGGTMTGDLTVQGAFTSQGIDDNGTSTRMTIGSGSDNAVMIGTTVSNPVSNNVQGISFRGAYGEVQISSEGSSGAPLYLNRKSSDGVIEVFRKDGNDVGSIGAHSSGTYLGTADTGIYFNGGNDSIDPYNPSVPINRDNAISLGAGSRRFKDAYLSGGIYLGGTGSANKLDDFETGSFTPTFTSSGTAPSLTYSTQGGTYVKVGNLVTIWIKLRINNISSAGSGNLRVAGLPFTVTDACAETGGSVGLWLSMASATGTEIIQQRSGGQQLFVLQNTTNGAHSVSAMANGGYLRCTTSYTTA